MNASKLALRAAVGAVAILGIAAPAASAAEISTPVAPLSGTDMAQGARDAAPELPSTDGAFSDMSLSL